MITERARIVAVDDDDVWIEARRESACGRCAVRSGCGHGLLEQAASARVVHLRLPRPDDLGALAEGDEMLVGIPDDAVLAGSLRVYGLPLAGFLIGALAGEGLVGGDAAAALGAVAGLAAAVVGLRWLDLRRPPAPPRLLRRAVPTARPDEAAADEPRRITVV
jgi:sigma-E factor negative regulatory protein RseC